MFFVKCIENDGVLTRVEVKVPKHLAGSPQVAANLVNDQKHGRMVSHPVEFVRFDDSHWFLPVDTGGFEKSLPNEPIFAGRYRLRKDLHLLGRSLKPQQGKEDSNASVQTSFKS